MAFSPKYENPILQIYRVWGRNSSRFIAKNYKTGRSYNEIHPEKSFTFFCCLLINMVILKGVYAKHSHTLIICEHIRTIQIRPER